MIEPGADQAVWVWVTKNADEFAEEAVAHLRARENGNLSGNQFLGLPRRCFAEPDDARRIATLAAAAGVAVVTAAR